MRTVYLIFERELLGYFRTPLAYVFIVAFLGTSIGLPWYLDDLFESNDANLRVFFKYTPWVFSIFIPAVGMRLWSEERKTGTWELLLTLPLTTGQAVIAKFLAGWAFISIAIMLSFPLPMTMGYLGDPDWGPIVSGYLVSIVMAGSYLSIASLMSAMTSSQVISFVLGVVVSLAMVLLGWSVFNNLFGFLPVAAVDAMANFSFITHFEAAKGGLIRAEDVVFFFGLSGFCLAANTVVLER